MNNIIISKNNWLQSLRLLQKQADMYFSKEITYKELLRLRKKSEREERNLRNIYVKDMQNKGLI